MTDEETAVFEGAIARIEAERARAELQLIDSSKQTGPSEEDVTEYVFAIFPVALEEIINAGICLGWHVSDIRRRVDGVLRKTIEATYDIWHPRGRAADADFWKGPFCRRIDWLIRDSGEWRQALLKLEEIGRLQIPKSTIESGNVAGCNHKVPDNNANRATIRSAWLKEQYERQATRHDGITSDLDLENSGGPSRKTTRKYKEGCSSPRTVTVRGRIAKALKVDISSVPE